MNKKEIEDHRVVASEMEWDGLASIIIDLELEKAELKEYHTKSDIEKYDKLLEIYEVEKSERVQNLSIYTLGSTKIA